MALLRWMGVVTPSQNSADDSLKPNTGGVWPINHADYKQFGLENFGNTCYANSVLQALYFCQPFRELVCDAHDKSIPPIPQPTLPSPFQIPATPVQRPLVGKGFRWRDSTHDTSKISDDSSMGGTASAKVPPAPTAPVIPPTPPTLFSALRSLFLHIALNPLDKGTVSPASFIAKVKKENELYRSSMHQDAHEFLGFLLNKIVEDLEAEMKKNNESGAQDSTCSIGSLPGPSSSASQSNSSGSQRSWSSQKTFVHSLFEGTLTSETRCLTCETVSSRDESFLDLSIDIEQNSSVTACLRQFSASEMLSQKNKFFCDSCGSLQEAEKRMKIKQLPNVLALHLKRFKYQEDVGKYIKLSYRVAFPFELRLFNTVDDAPDPDRLYRLFAIVVHIGGGPHHGHYVAIVKAHGLWYMFDDDAVESIREGDIPKYFGDSNGGAGYVLFYQAVDLDLASVGIDASNGAEADVTVSTSLPTQSTVSEVEAVNGKGDQRGHRAVPSVTLSSPPSKPTSVPLKVQIPGIAEPNAPSAVPTITPTALPSDILTSPISPSSASNTSNTPASFLRTLRTSPSMRLSKEKRRASSSSGPEGEGGNANGDATIPPVPSSPLVHSKSFKGKDRNSDSSWRPLWKAKDKEKERPPIPTSMLPSLLPVRPDTIVHSIPPNATTAPNGHPTPWGAEDDHSEELDPPSFGGGSSTSGSSVSMAPTQSSAPLFTAPPPVPQKPAPRTLPVTIDGKSSRPSTSPPVTSPAIPFSTSTDMPPLPPSISRSYELSRTPPQSRIHSAVPLSPSASSSAERPKTAGARPGRSSRKMSLTSMFGRRDRNASRSQGEENDSPLSPVVPLRMPQNTMLNGSGVNEPSVS